MATERREIRLFFDSNTLEALLKGNVGGLMVGEIVLKPVPHDMTISGISLSISDKYFNSLGVTICVKSQQFPVVPEGAFTPMGFFTVKQK